MTFKDLKRKVYRDEEDGPPKKKLKTEKANPNKYGRQWEADQAGKRVSETGRSRKTESFLVKFIFCRSSSSSEEIGSFYVRPSPSFISEDLPVEEKKTTPKKPAPNKITTMPSVKQTTPKPGPHFKNSEKTPQFGGKQDGWKKQGKEKQGGSEVESEEASEDPYGYLEKKKNAPAVTKKMGGKYKWDTLKGFFFFRGAGNLFVLPKSNRVQEW
jgi:hypothetical protein